MVKCSAYQCKSASYKRTPGLSFHKFPKDNSLKKIWVQNMDRKDWQPNASSVLCSKHFEPHLKDSSVFCTVLKPRAIPTLFGEYLEGEEMIVRVYRYLQTEYEQLKQWTGHSCDLSPLANILKRAAAATGVSEHTVTSLLQHDQRPEETSDDDEQTDAKRLRLDIDERNVINKSVKCEPADQPASETDPLS